MADRNTLWFVSGRVVIDETDVPIPNVLVRIWDEDVVDDDLLAEIRTNHDGSFAASFPKHRFDDGGIEQQPDLYLRVHVPHNEHVLLTTEFAVRENAARMERFELRVPHVEINRADGPELLRLRPQISGTVYLPTEMPARGAAIELVDPEGEVFATTATSAKGTFAIWFEDPKREQTFQLRVLDRNAETLYTSHVMRYDGLVPRTHRVMLESNL